MGARICLPQRCSLGNYDGIVNLLDFNLLAGRFGLVLAAELNGSGRGGSSTQSPFSDQAIHDEEDTLAELLA